VLGLGKTCIGDWEELIDGVDSKQETPNREIGFGFVSRSWRACERAGEAKLCGRVRGESFSTLGVSVLTFPPAVVGSWISLFRFCCYAHGF
jgi:hypothetical protein